jgi:hypothetical protein
MGNGDTQPLLVPTSVAVSREVLGGNLAAAQSFFSHK